nr:E3 ubiquitin-protein ligase ATL15-like [Ipomoea batatas]
MAERGSTPLPPPVGSEKLVVMAHTDVILVCLICGFLVMGCVVIYFHQCADRLLARDFAGDRIVRQRRGLDSDVIDAFPRFRYSDVKALMIGNGVALECAVCLNEFDDGKENLRLLPRCCHVFHTHCIDAWLAAHVTCPVCRANLIVGFGQQHHAKLCVKLQQLGFLRRAFFEERSSFKNILKQCNQRRRFFLINKLHPNYLPGNVSPMSDTGKHNIQETYLAALPVADGAVEDFQILASFFRVLFLLFSFRGKRILREERILLPRVINILKNHKRFRHRIPIVHQNRNLFINWVALQQQRTLLSRHEIFFHVFIFNSLELQSPVNSQGVRACPESQKLHSLFRHG